ncbi:hypothetical protein ABZ357_10860 [Streptomyces sp. NPDC005917]|uniref:hypothetical protein n=1 Tax=unclassified Streptomyces TaxID=2593676 RepID=UPI0033C3A4D8
MSAEEIKALRSLLDSAEQGAHSAITGGPLAAERAYDLVRIARNIVANADIRNGERRRKRRTVAA